MKNQFRQQSIAISHRNDITRAQNEQQQQQTKVVKDNRKIQSNKSGDCLPTEIIINSKIYCRSLLAVAQARERSYRNKSLFIALACSINNSTDMCNEHCL